jgi:large subunit ribosomal protein L15
MQIHELRSAYTKKEKRVGRGGKRGTTSGRGQKGQGARAGRKLRPAERDILLKFPKLRGVKNPAKRVKKHVVEFKISQLEKMFHGEKVITKDLFIKKGIISYAQDKVKIIGNNEIKTAFSVEGISVSAGAKKMIEKAGGKVQ